MSVRNVWESKEYYDLAHEASLDTEYWGMKELVKLTENASTILDLGCGEGTRLAYVAKNKKGTGVDISKTAITLAKKKYPKLHFINADLSKLPFKKNEFDIAYSAAVLEHLVEPEKVMREAIRVLKPGGHLVLMCPNYGSPNRCSPVYKKSRIKKLVFGFIKDLFVVRSYRSRSRMTLEWEKVQPNEDPNQYEMDLDTTEEPYIRTLLPFLKQHGMIIEKWSTCWEEELPGAKIHQKLFRILSNLKIYPFTQWGPHLVVISKKIS